MADYKKQDGTEYDSTPTLTKEEYLRERAGAPKHEGALTDARHRPGPKRIP